MGSTKDMVYYCCVVRGSRILYSYSGVDQEIEKLVALSLASTPPYHKWYFETIGKRTFGFLMEDGYVYFTIIDEGLGNLAVLKFLQHVRDEFKRVTRRGSRGSFSGLSSSNLQEQLAPIVRHLITSLEHLSQSGNNWSAETSSSDNAGLSPSPSGMNGPIEASVSTKAPLLGKSSKQDKKKPKDHVISMRDIELEEHRKSTDRGIKADSPPLDSKIQTTAGPPSTSQKEFGLMRTRSSSQNMRRKWCRQVRIILAIDAAVCIVMFIIWLSICGGFGCIH